MRWLCDCTLWKNGEEEVPKYYGRFFPTQIDTEGKCVKCGHYAISESHHKRYPRTHRQGGYEPIVSSQMLRKYSKGMSEGLSYLIKGEPLWRTDDKRFRKEKI